MENLDFIETNLYPQNYDAVIAAMRIVGFKFRWGVEIGVRHGFFTKALLEAFPELHMIAVDPYEPYLDVGNYVFNISEQTRIKTTAYHLLLEYSTTGRLEWLYHRSLTGAELCRDKFGQRADDLGVDFVFIDAAHEFQAVREDLEAWERIVRHGGLLCGHDYDMMAVKMAVNEFAEARKLKVIHAAYPADVWMVQL
jgi:hypothetical protein